MRSIDPTNFDLLVGRRLGVNMLSTGMWVEKYRPTKLSEIVNQTEIIGSLKALIANPADMPHLLFSGSAGVGKTTAAMCISKQILGEYAKEYTLELNASDETRNRNGERKSKEILKICRNGRCTFQINYSR